MSITFRTRGVSVDETMPFEAVYEEPLRLTAEEKYPLLAEATISWIYADGILVGETFSVSVPVLRKLESDDPIPDTKHPRYDNPCVEYVYSTTILPPYQGKGYGKLLVAHHLGQCAEQDVRLLIGHTTSTPMHTVRRLFGARFDMQKIHQNWYGSGRTAQFYELDVQ